MAIAQCLFVFGYVYASATSDNSDLVQARLLSSDPDADPATLPPVPTPPPTNYTAPTAAPTVPPYSPEYRLSFQQTWGDDHVCMTEIEFYDMMGNKLQVDYNAASSCWGCAVSCSNCTVDYGNPHVLFDGDHLTDSPTAYFCSDYDEFDMDGANGNYEINFNLPMRPMSFKLRRPDIQGSAIAKAFTLSEKQRSGDWEVIAIAADKKQELDQLVHVKATSGPAGRWWEFTTPKCMEEEPVANREQTLKRLEYEYLNISKGGWGNNGKGVYFDANLGSLTLDDELYYAKQIHFQFPSHRMKGSERNALGGELHITHQKKDGKGTSHLHQQGLAIVIIPLRLPLETGVPSKTELWFDRMGLTDLPVEGATKDLNSNFSLGSVFDEQLGGSYRELACEADADGSVPAGKPRWFLLDEPAYVTGKVMLAFKNMFPFDIAYQKVDDTYTVWVQNMKDTQMDRSTEAGESVNAVDRSWEPVKTIPMAPGIEWKPNDGYITGCSEFMPIGEWWLPPLTTTTTTPPIGQREMR